MADSSSANERSNAHDALPLSLRGLKDLALNLWWTWNPTARVAFSRLDPSRWQASMHNPVAFLRSLPASQLLQAADDAPYLQAYRSAMDAFQKGVKRVAGAKAALAGGDRLPSVAYFSAEYALHDLFPSFAGGLGVLAGDHLKEASDIGMELVAIGLLYRYRLVQRFDRTGWQQERYEALQECDHPIQLVSMSNGQPMRIRLTLGGREITLRLWRLEIGRIQLYFLDSHSSENPERDRDLMAHLYPSEPHLRLQQEFILGAGGVAALRAMGLRPRVYHLNEGHAAFASLEILRENLRNAASLEEAVEETRKRTIFTTHTPVAAAHDAFPLDMIETYLGDYLDGFGVPAADVYRLADPGHPGDASFNLAALAIRLSGKVNGVSKIHGQTARHMWAHLWPSLPEELSPIGSITNGVHAPTWIATPMRALFDKHLGTDWLERIDDPSTWEPVADIPAEDLWSIRLALKHRLRWLWIAGDGRDPMGAASDAHDWEEQQAGPEDDVLTIGFARRFTAYKRATLILQDRERLLNLLNVPGKPLRIIFAGKAHTEDLEGKAILQQILGLAREEGWHGKLIFIPDYNLSIARYLVSGVDLWLNTPLVPNEACGTSGMKAALNGVLNLSVLDGWWAEAYTPGIGWALQPSAQEQLRTDQESSQLYSLLEEEIIPLYYRRDARGIPVEWLARVKDAIKELAPRFNSRRMLREYLRAYRQLGNDEGAETMLDPRA